MPVSNSAPLPSFLPPMGQLPTGVDTDGDWLYFRNALCSDRGDWSDIAVLRADLLKGRVLPMIDHRLQEEALTVIPKAAYALFQANMGSTAFLFKTNGQPASDALSIIDSPFEVLNGKGNFHELQERKIDRRQLAAEVFADAPTTTKVARKAYQILSPKKDLTNALSSIVITRIAAPSNPAPINLPPLPPANASPRVVATEPPVARAPSPVVSEMESVVSGPLPALSSLPEEPSPAPSNASSPISSPRMAPSSSSVNPIIKEWRDLLEAWSVQYGTEHPGSFLEDVRYSDLKPHTQNDSEAAKKGKAALRKLVVNPESDDADAVEMRNWLIELSRKLFHEYWVKIADENYSDYTCRPKVYASIDAYRKAQASGGFVNSLDVPRLDTTPLCNHLIKFFSE
ncbi:MAG TPA: hypothetical protein VLE89_00245 [Chlamydiales bacterium]|nr:hypothetical protein [Chlamydiales bacterium]